jgi:hypothetical protein
VSLKIVFNGKQYDDVDAMPPDVRREYEVALETLRKTGGEEILSLLQQGGGPAARAARGSSIGRTEQARGGGVWRVFLWMALGAVAAWLFLRRG